ncbi:MAG: hypothetical protein AB1485_09475 [Candidatus Thermoplasmatota archaeon]
MSSPRQQISPYYLIVESIIKSTAKRFLLFFRPKETIASEPYEINLKITNKSDRPFPGGITEKILELEYETSCVLYEKEAATFEKHAIEHIARDESIILSVGEGIAIREGIAWIYLKIKADDNMPIKYYQVNKFSKKLDLLDREFWLDWFRVTSRYEIHQRYTNRLLLILTLIMLISLLLGFWK